MGRGNPLIDVTGQRFGRLVVLERGENYVRPGGGRGTARWICLCDCGSKTLVHGKLLRSGRTSSCGCHRRDLAISIGRANRRQVVSYASVHRRVKEERGPARMHPCVDCGETAKEWSYYHADPDELTHRVERRGRVDQWGYSLKAEHYFPRCKPCHNRLDQAHANG